jgi:transcriptional regulator with XRE-family HTH domain
MICATLSEDNGAGGSDVGTILDVMPRISGVRLRKVRDRRLLSQRELAERAGLSPTTILKLESGRVDEPHPRTIRKLADALEVDPAELVEGE